MAADQAKQYKIEIQRMVRQVEVIHELAVKYQISRLEKVKNSGRGSIHNSQNHRAITTPREQVQTNTLSASGSRRG